MPALFGGEPPTHHTDRPSRGSTSQTLTGIETPSKKIKNKKIKKYRRTGRAGTSGSGSRGRDAWFHEAYRWIFSYLITEVTGRQSCPSNSRVPPCRFAATARGPEFESVFSDSTARPYCSRCGKRFPGRLDVAVTVPAYAKHRKPVVPRAMPCQRMHDESVGGVSCGVIGRL